MTVWVFSGFTITGNNEEIDRFRSKMFKTVRHPYDEHSTTPPEFGVILDFNGIIPAPQNLPQLELENWRLEHWGTSWNACHLELLSEADGKLGFQFETAWDFPLPVFRALAKEFPDLVFSGSAFEQGHEFEYLGEFNGKNSWGPGRINWIVGPTEGNDEEEEEEED